MDVPDVPTMPENTFPLDFLLIVNSWQKHAKWYKVAADRLVDAATAGPGAGFQEKFALPVAFLYRHYLELTLKNLVRGGVGLKKIPPMTACKADHNLHKHWNKAKELLNHICDTSDARLIASTEKLVLEYHAVDESGCTFRYPEKNDGTRYLDSLPKHGSLAAQLKALNLSAMQKEIDKVHKFLEHACDILNAHPSTESAHAAPSDYSLSIS